MKRNYENKFSRTTEGKASFENYVFEIRFEEDFLLLLIWLLKYFCCVCWQFR